MAKMSVGELKLELSNILLDLIGFEADNYSQLINKAKTIEDLDRIIDYIVHKENNAQFEKKLVLFWKNSR